MKVIPIYPLYSESNSYIVTSDDTNSASSCDCIVIDPGDDAQRIYGKVTDNGYKLKKIVLTHAHFDHIIAVNELVKLTGVEVLIHKDDLQALYEPSLNLSSWATFEDCIIDPDVKVIPLTDGDTVQLGNEFLTVMSTPGHTPGSACFICGDIIFTGDTLFGGTIGRTDFPGSDVGSMRESLKRLSALDGDYTLYPGHNGETTLSREKAHNYYLHKDFLG